MINPCDFRELLSAGSEKGRDTEEERRKETLGDISPIIRGWINYYGSYYKLKRGYTFYCLNGYLNRWVFRKYKRFRNRQDEELEHDDVLKAARKTAELSFFRYTQGLVTFLEVVDAERTRLDAELEAVRIVNEQLLSVVQLIKALGGGWDPEADNES